MLASIGYYGAARKKLVRCGNTACNITSVKAENSFEMKEFDPGSD